MYLSKVFLNIIKAIFIFLGAIVEVVAISIIFKTPLSIDFIIILIVIPFIIYFFDFISSSNKKQGYYVILLVLSLLLISLIFVFKGIFPTVILILLLIIGILYPIYFKHLSCRILGFKDFFVAACWNLAVIFYFFYYAVPISITLVLFLIFVYFRDFTNVNYCDLKDVSKDNKEGLKTFATQLGTYKLFILLYLLNIVSIVILLIGTINNLMPKTAMLLVVPISITSLLFYFSYKTKKYPSWVVDIEYFFWLISVL